jgi:hemerythrin-like domain-containing protein
MKRSAALLQLSREHHGALVLALAAKRAAAANHAADIAMVAKRIGATFARELEPHFREEETWLLPQLLAAGEAERVARTLAEHAELRALVAQLHQPDAATLLRFAERLKAHVRFEEDELFAAAEKRAIERPDASSTGSE